MFMCYYFTSVKYLILFLNLKNIIDNKNTGLKPQLLLFFFCHNIRGYLEIEITLHQFVNSYLFLNTAIEKNDNSSLVTGIGVACFLLGAAICGLVCLIITRNRRTKLR